MSLKPKAAKTSYKSLGARQRKMRQPLRRRNRFSKSFPAVGPRPQEPSQGKARPPNALTQQLQAQEPSTSSPRTKARHSTSDREQRHHSQPQPRPALPPRRRLSNPPRCSKTGRASAWSSGTTTNREKCERTRRILLLSTPMIATGFPAGRMEEGAARRSPSSRSSAF